MKIVWDEWRGSLEGDVVMRTKSLARAFGCKVDLHGFIGTDAPGCFHTHPAYALRAILRNGYVEEIESRGLRAWRAGDIGIIPPGYSHRVAFLLGAGPVLSLWIRGPKIAEVQLRGAGWPAPEPRRPTYCPGCYCHMHPNVFCPVHGHS